MDSVSTYFRKQLRLFDLGGTSTMKLTFNIYVPKDGGPREVWATITDEGSDELIGSASFYAGDISRGNTEITTCFLECLDQLEQRIDPFGA